MKKLFSGVTLLILLGQVTLSAGGSQDENVPEAYIQYPKALGAQYGLISATGISYQQWIDQIGLQLTGSIIYEPFDEDLWYGTDDGTLDYNAGAEVQFRIFGADFTPWLSGQLYAFVGVKHRGYISIDTIQEQVCDENSCVDPVFAVGSYKPVVGLGGGIGTEIILCRHFSIPVEIGYGVDWSPLSGSDIADQLIVELRPQVGLRYRF